MKNHLLHYPTPDELRALELAAHRARSREILRLLGAGAQKLKSLADHLTAAHGGEGIGHA